MPAYDLAASAVDDLKAIARYTSAEWGSKQAKRYGALLEAHFAAIASGRAKTRIFLRRRPELRVSRVKHHFVFHLEREDHPALILAVFHGKMDLMARLRDRLEP